MSAPTKAQLLAEIETLKTTMSTNCVAKASEISLAYSTIGFKNGEKPLYEQLSTVYRKYNSTIEGLNLDIAKKYIVVCKMK